MTEATIKELNPTSRNKILEVKVYRSWIGRNPPNVTEKSYHSILLDKQVTLICYIKYIKLLFFFNFTVNKYFYNNRVMQYKQTWMLVKKNSSLLILSLEEPTESQGSHVLLQSIGNKRWRTKHPFYLPDSQNLILYHQQASQITISVLPLTIGYHTKWLIQMTKVKKCTQF